MWYHMKRKTLEREYDEFEQRLQQLRRRSEQPAREHMTILLRTMQRFHQEIVAIDQQFRLLSSGVSDSIGSKESSVFGYAIV